MKDNFFFSKKNCIKTTWKARFLFLFSAAIFLIGFHQFCLDKLYGFLTPSESIGNVDAILIEGWNYDLQVRKAVDLFKKGHANLLFTTGFEVVKFSECYGTGTLAEVVRNQIIDMGVNPSLVIAIIQPERGTYTEAISSKTYFEKHQIRSVAIVTTAGHMKRTYLTFNKVFGNSLKIVPVPVAEDWFLKTNWWKTHTGMEFLASEYFKLIYYWAKGYI